MSRFLAALLVFAVLVWSAAAAPGWSLNLRPQTADATVATAPATQPARDPIRLAALDTADDLDIAAWMDRAQHELDTQWATWNQLDAAQLQTSSGLESHGGRHYGGGASGDALLAYHPPGVRQLADLPGFGPSINIGGGHFGGFGGVPGGSAKRGGKNPTANDGSPNGNSGSGSSGDNDKPPQTPPTQTATDNPDSNIPNGTNPPQANPPVTESPGIPPDNFTPNNDNLPTVTVPEPDTIGLLGLGLMGLALSRRRCRSA